MCIRDSAAALKFGAEARRDEVEYFDDEADWRVPSSAKGGRRRQPTVRRELYGPHTERL